MARSPEPHLWRRSPRSVRIHVADGVEPRDDDHQLRAPWISNRRADAGHAPGVARGRLLSLRPDLRPRSAGLSRSGVRMVGHPRSVRAREARCARAKSSVAEAAVPRLSDEHDACAVWTGGAVSAGLVTDARLGCVRQRPTSSVDGGHAGSHEPAAKLHARDVIRVRDHRGLSAAASARQHGVVAIGDHQPPAAVSGPGASWSVPVHVFGRRGPILDRLRQGLPRRARAASPADRPDARAHPDVARSVQQPIRSAARLATQSPVASATRYQRQTTRPAPPE